MLITKPKRTENIDSPWEELVLFVKDDANSKDYTLRGTSMTWIGRMRKCRLSTRFTSMGKVGVGANRCGQD